MTIMLDENNFFHRGHGTLDKTYDHMCKQIFHYDLVMPYGVMDPGYYGAS